MSNRRLPAAAGPIKLRDENRLPLFTHSKEQKRRYDQSILDFATLGKVTCPYHALSLINRTGMRQLYFDSEDKNELELVKREADYGRQRNKERRNRKIQNLQKDASIYEVMKLVRNFESYIDKSDPSKDGVRIIGKSQGLSYSDINFYIEAATNRKVYLISLYLLASYPRFIRGIKLTEDGQNCQRLHLDFTRETSTGAYDYQRTYVIKDGAFYTGSQSSFADLIPEESALIHIQWHNNYLRQVARRNK
jgi:hypothetical protein